MPAARSRPVPPTAEDTRLALPLVPGGSPAARELLERSGFAALADAAVARLRSAGDLAAAAAAAREEGQRLWTAAMDRAQGRGSAGGDLDALDDRPLYWARLAVAAAVRALDSDVLALPQHRHGLLRLLDRASRGLDDPPWPAGAPQGTTRVAVSGFDVFSLDDDLRHSNPSGAAALALAGRVLDTPAGPVVVRAVVLPVSYGAFDEGIVEDAFGPVLVPGPDRADMITTISMTSRGRMDVEAWAGGARGGHPDNERAQRFGAVSRAAHWPQPFDSPEWIATTLPHAAMVGAGTGPWPVVLREGVLEQPAGTSPDPAAVRAVPRPTPGSTAAAGTGGDYLSNESMYRSNRLRQGLGAWDVPGGHLHVSALELPADPGALADAASAADRRAVVEQTVELVRAAGAAVRASREQRRGAGD